MQTDMNDKSQTDKATDKERIDVLIAISVVSKVLANKIRHENMKKRKIQVSKMSELSMVIDEMFTCGEGILKAIQYLTICGERMIKVAKQVKDIFSTENLPELKVVTLPIRKPLPVKEEQSLIAFIGSTGDNRLPSPYKSG